MGCVNMNSKLRLTSFFASAIVSQKLIFAAFISYSSTAVSLENPMMFTVLRSIGHFAGFGLSLPQTIGSILFKCVHISAHFANLVCNADN